MNLVIDQGNTLTKIAIFNGEMLVFSQSMQLLDNGVIAQIVTEQKIEKALFSSVSQFGEKDFEFLKKLLPQTVLLDSATPLPFKNNYATPHTIGKDRLAAVAGAIARYPGSNLLVIDAGTAITYEMVDSSHTYWGGNIAPGLQMRFKALNTFTGKLPLCYPDKTVGLIGDSTQTAIVAGVQNGLVFEIEGYIERLERQFSNLKTIITGGDSEFFAEKVKYPIFVHHNLVLEGLNRILKYNA